MKARNYPESAFEYVTTGGSTGIPVGFYYEKGVSRAREWAFMKTQWDRVGYRFTDRCVVLRGYIIGSAKNDTSLVGRTFEEIARDRGLPPEDVYLDIILSEEAGVTIVIMSHSESDMERILKHPFSMIGSDSSPNAFDGPLAQGNPHPRCFGCYPRLLGTYVRDKKLFSMEEAIRKCTGMPASRFKLFDRGVIREGLRADLVVFDKERIQDRSEYRNSRQRPEGIDFVVKNGRVIVEDGRVVGPILGKSVRVR